MDVTLSSETHSQPNQLTGVQRLLEAGLLVTTVFSMFLMLAIYTFDPADPGWSQTGYQTPIRNLGGAVGAYLSDMLLSVFGFFAYFIPFIIAVMGWMLFQRIHALMQIDYLTLGLRIIGFILFTLGITALLSMHSDDIHYFSAGGILGDYTSSAFIPYFSIAGSNLLFLMLLGSGFVLLTGFSFLTFIDKTGEYAIKGAIYLKGVPAIIKEKFGTGDIEHDAASDKVKIEAYQTPMVEQEEVKQAFTALQEADDEQSKESVRAVKEELFLNIDELLNTPIDKEDVVEEDDDVETEALADDDVVEEVSTATRTKKQPLKRRWISTKVCLPLNCLIERIRTKTLSTKKNLIRLAV